MAENIQQGASARQVFEPTMRETTKQRVRQRWSCSQVEDEEGVWQNEDRMEMQWAEKEKLATSFEQKWMEGFSLKTEAIQKVHELMVHERVCQVIDVKGTKEKKKVKGWSTEEMNNHESSYVVEGTEEMAEWRSINQEEMDRC